MGKARAIAIRQYIKRHGLTLSWVAKSMGMSEGLLRYHIGQGFESSDLIILFKSLMRAHAAAVVDDLAEIQDKKNAVG